MWLGPIDIPRGIYHPCVYHQNGKNKGSLIYQTGEIGTHVCGTSPYGHLYWVPPPPPPGHGCSYKGVLSVNLFYGSVGCGFRLSIAVVIPLSSHSHTHTHSRTRAHTLTHTHTHTHKKKITQFMQPCWVLLQHISTIIIFNQF